MWSWFRVDGGVSRTELEVRFAHLAQGQGVVEGRDGDVAAVEDGEGCLVGVQRGAVVEAAEGGLPGRGGADGAWAESCSFFSAVLGYGKYGIGEVDIFLITKS